MAGQDGGVDDDPCHRPTNHPSPVRREPVEGQAPLCFDKLGTNGSGGFGLLPDLRGQVLVWIFWTALS